jgi:hypothetical protein
VRDREDDLQILEAALADHTSPEFGLLLEVFALPAAYTGTLVRVLQEGSWRASDEQIAYVWRATMRTVSQRDTERVVAKRDDEGRNWRERTTRRTPSDEKITWMHHRAETSEPCRMRSKNGRSVWRQGGGREEERETREVSLMSREIPDWQAIAAKADLDQWERVALQFMGQGMTRYSALKGLKGAPAEERRALEAAWRRLERSKFEKVRGILV